MNKGNEVSKIVNVILGKYFLHFPLSFRREHNRDFLYRLNPAALTVRLISKGFFYEIPFYFQSVKLHSAKEVTQRRVEECSAALLHKVQVQHLL
jgi:hypothetical protein